MFELSHLSTSALVSSYLDACGAGHISDALAAADELSQRTDGVDLLIVPALWPAFAGVPAERLAPITDRVQSYNFGVCAAANRAAR